jgi:hypothetical protein
VTTRDLIVAKLSKMSKDGREDPGMLGFYDGATGLPQHQRGRFPDLWAGAWQWEDYLQGYRQGQELRGLQEEGIQ